MVDRSRGSTVVVVPEPGTPDTGLWCDHCQLPSLVRFPMNAVLPNGVLPLGYLDLCTDHQTPGEVISRWRPRL